MNINFDLALSSTLKTEGKYSADRLDPGGETFMGISRVYWPSWSGWPKIDQWKIKGGPPPDLQQEVEQFYYENFWQRIQGDRISQLSAAIATELFDTAVNMSVSDAVRFLQTALNMQNEGATIYPDLQVDGRLGPRTIETLQAYLFQKAALKTQNETILLNCMNGEQYIAYKNNPRHEHFRGWFARV